MLPLARLLVNLLKLATFPLWVLLRRRGLGRPGWVVLRVRGHVVQLERRRGAWLRDLTQAFRPRRLAVAEVRALREKLAADPNVQGLLVYVGHLSGGWATLCDLRGELAGLSAAGKRVVAYLPVGASQRELLVASGAERVYTAPAVSFSALGPMVARAYLAGLLRKLGIRVEVMAEGLYKTAAEPLVRDTMSLPEREQLTAIVATLADTWVKAVGARPKLGEGGARTLLDTAYFGAERAREAGLVDGCHYEDELASLLELPAKRRPVEARPYMVRATRAPLLLPLRDRPKVAVVKLEGVIAEQPSQRGIGLGAATSCLRAVLEHPHILGVILYIDSPGGSAVVSDLLHREVVRLDAKKPVVAWLGNVAASGGYYLAAGARHIVAAPGTLTGSIGVISARPALSDLLDKLDVREEVVKLTPHADIHSIGRELSPRERELLQGEAHRFYTRFLDVVAQGRKRTRAQVDAVAGGRVWSGADALGQGLVDELGGYAEARAALDRALGERARTIAVEPLVVEPPRRDATPLLPIREAALASFEGAFGEHFELLQLCRREHLLACALELVRLD